MNEKETQLKIVEVVRDLMRSRYGFECNNGQFSKEGANLYYEFDTETPKGQTSFFIKRQQAYINFWNEQNYQAPAIVSIEIRVAYDHHNSGSNSNGQSYDVTITKKHFTDEIEIQLFAQTELRAYANAKNEVLRKEQNEKN